MRLLYPTETPWTRSDICSHTPTHRHTLVLCLVVVVFQSYLIAITNIVLFICHAVVPTSWLPSRRQRLIGRPPLLPCSPRWRKDGHPSPRGRRSEGEACEPAAEQHACCWGGWKLEYYAEYVSFRIHTYMHICIYFGCGKFTEGQVDVKRVLPMRTTKNVVDGLQGYC